MKKIMMLLMVAVLMLGISGQAMAAFEDGHLVRVVYSTAGTNEIGTDLGSVKNLTSLSTQNVVFNANNFDFAALGGNANASNTYVAYYTVTTTDASGNTNKAWLSGLPTGETIAKSKFSGYAGDAHSANGLYQVASGGAAQATVLMSDPNSYWNTLNNSGAAVGKMNNFITASGGNAEMSLADLATVGYVDQVLYYYSSPSGISGTASGLKVATIRTFADGHTELNPSAVPVPAAVYLFGSGLLGLVGLRRKMAA